jgi:hypothetical protein
MRKSCLHFLFQTIDNIIKFPICVRIQNISHKENWTIYKANI